MRRDNRRPQMTSSPKSRVFYAFLAGSTIFAAFAYLLNVSWNKWGNLVIDTGREVVVPERLLSGSVLYKDVMYPYGPFSPYFHALLCKIFGLNLTSFAVSGIMTAALTAILVYAIARIYLAITDATLAALTFLFVCAFANYSEVGIFNFVMPYAFPSTHSVVFCLLALVLLYRELRRSRGVQQIGIGLLVLLTSMTRIEIGVILGCVLAFGMALDRGYAARFRRILCCVALPWTMAFAIYALFKRIAGERLLASGAIFAANLETRNPFTDALFGTAALSENLRAIAYMGCYYLAFFAAAYVWDSRCRKHPGSARYSLAGGGLCFLGLILYAAYVLPLFNQYMPLPFICLALGVTALVRFFKGQDVPRSLFLATYSLFAFVMLGRMLLHCWAAHYGFYLLVAGLVCYYIFFLEFLPRTLTHDGMRLLFRLSFIVLAALFIREHARTSLQFYEGRTFEVETPRGKMNIYPKYRNYAALINYLESQTPQAASLIVFPEGSLFNFLTGRGNPLYYYSFLPIDFLQPRFQEAVVQGLERSRMDYVAIISRDTSEYGQAIFGIYAADIYRYLKKNYTVESVFGGLPQAPQPDAVLMRRLATEASQSKVP